MGKLLGFLFLFILGFSFFFHLGLNDIWMQNESFYAETVREMLENHNFLEPFYNYEPRFNKPPMTYWLILMSVIPFGLYEFTVRLSIALLGLGTIFLTFLIGKFLFNQKVGFYSAVAVSLSVLFIANSRYASPEIPLTFFFTLTMYFFIKGYKTNQWKYYLWAYVSLGFAVLTKWFPYYLIIGGIILLFIFLDSRLNLKIFWKKFKSLKIHIGLPIALVIGMWWTVYMYLKYKDQFLAKAFKETFHRATGTGCMNHVDFLYYLKVALWGFLPYSLVFFIGLFLIKEIYKNNRTASLFLFSWIIVPYIIFSISYGKISTYILQIFPALAIFSGLALVNFKKNNIFKKILFNGSLIIPSFLYMFLSFYLIFYMNFSLWLGFIGILPFVLSFFTKDVKLLPFFSVFSFLILFIVFILPEIEKFRPYDTIGNLIKTEDPEKKFPTLVQHKKIYNLPFYAERKIIQEANLSQINNKRNFIALVYKKDLSYFKDTRILWCGDIYRFGGDSRTFVFLRYIKKYKKGDKSGFVPMCLIKKGGDNERADYAKW